jgi:hypothetical protein
MLIENVSLMPAEPIYGQTLEIRVSLHNDSSTKKSEAINATLGSPHPSFPTAVQQLRVRLGPHQRREVLLFKLIIDERFQPGKYTIGVRIAGKSIETTQQFEIRDSEDAPKSF